LSGRRVVAPESLLAHYPELKKIADPFGDAQQGERLPLLA